MSGSRIVLGVTGSIAAFKAVQLASDLIKAGHLVRTVMTAGATHFVAPLSFEALTGLPVTVDVWDKESGDSRMGHLDLARWADVLVVAPASAGALARLALGLTDDMLGAVALASPAPLLVAPAMETGMYAHPATRTHLTTLLERGAIVVGPEMGRLASGTEGAGRMSEPADILMAVENLLTMNDRLSGLKVLVTAGPTYEPIDRVRFVGNRSSGKMGYAVAQEAARRGATVTVVSGPTALLPPNGVSVVPVETAAQMEEAVLAHAPQSDVVVMAAAVADFRPETIIDGKLKRKGRLTLDLVPTSDIASAASAAAPHAVHIGFALESQDLLASASEKMRRKGQRLVVANEISNEHNPFASDRNRVAFVTADGVEEYPPMKKAEVARLLWDEIESMLPPR